MGYVTLCSAFYLLHLPTTVFVIEIQVTCMLMSLRALFTLYFNMEDLFSAVSQDASLMLNATEVSFNDND